jgi:uncharacterized protein
VRDARISMRDGVQTAAEVWTPEHGRPCPALPVRTPYGKERIAATAVVDARLAVARGYTVVLQDVRGRGQSAGSFDPFVNEQADGYDTVEWVARQPWCDGRVAMAGISYVGATQWLAAVGGPAGLIGIAPALSSDDYAEGWSFTAGIPEYGFLTSWSASELVGLEDRFLDDPSRSWDDLAAAQAIVPWLRDWLESQPGSAYWRARSVAHRRAEVQVPALVLGGWYDIFLAGSLRSFRASRDRRDRLIVGPWCHDEMLSHLVGVANVGIAGLGLEQAAGWILDFYDALLAGREPELPRVRAYVLGAKRWLELESWPPPGTQTLRLALRAGSFEVRPAAPVPSLGGRGLLVNHAGWGCGVLDQRSLADRDDVHVALHATLEHDLLLAGPIAAELSTSVALERPGEHLWTATLCLEQPDGALHNLAEGVARGSPAGGQVRVELGDSCALLHAGSRLVLLLAGSSYPRWPRPARAGEQRVLPGSELELTVAGGLALELATGDR